MQPACSKFQIGINLHKLENSQFETFKMRAVERPFLNGDLIIIGDNLALASLEISFQMNFFPQKSIFDDFCFLVLSTRNPLEEGLLRDTGIFQSGMSSLKRSTNFRYEIHIASETVLGSRNWPIRRMAFADIPDCLQR